MTIRQYLKAKWLVFWAAFAVWIGLGFFVQNLASWVTWPWLLAGIALLIAQFWIRCTRCKSHIPAAIGVGITKLFKPINFCPFCGTNLDDPAGP